MRSWREAQTVCQESRENLVTIRNEEDNAFLSCKVLEMQNKAMVKVDLAQKTAITEVSNLPHSVNLVLCY